MCARMLRAVSTCCVASAAELKDRRVEVLDISEAYHDKKAADYRADYDSTLYRSEKRGLGPLAHGWAARHAPVM